MASYVCMCMCILLHFQRYTEKMNYFRGVYSFLALTVCELYYNIFTGNVLLPFAISSSCDQQIFCDNAKFLFIVQSKQKIFILKNPNFSTRLQRMMKLENYQEVLHNDWVFSFFEYSFRFSLEMIWNIYLETKKLFRCLSPNQNGWFCFKTILIKKKFRGLAQNDGQIFES